MYNHSYTLAMKRAISVADAEFEAAEQFAQRMELSRSQLVCSSTSRIPANLS